MVKLNKAQQQALLRVWNRNPQAETYLELRRRVQPGWDCVMIKFGSIWLGIEPDGYTHS
jgi:hypothetical protein